VGEWGTGWEAAVNDWAQSTGKTVKAVWSRQQVRVGKVQRRSKWSGNNTGGCQLMRVGREVSAKVAEG